MQTLATAQSPSVETMFRACAAKDTRFDGVFFLAVKTTGVFCRPVCRAKPPRPQNVEFFATAREAMYHGYRPCKLCRPLDSGQHPPAVVQRLMNLVEQTPSHKLRERDLRAMKIDPSTARRQFRRYCRMTFAGYQRARRMGAALRQVRNGTPVIHAQIDAGYESGVGFREAFSKLFGTTASGANSVTMLVSRWLPTPLGPMLAIASDDGIVLLDFADRKGLEGAILRLRTKLAVGNTPAVIVPGDHAHLDQLARELAEYFSGTRRIFSVPLALRGSHFQHRAWDYLRSIGYGQTSTYSEQAKALGTPRAVRAVGRANGANFISILIPCHRVIASSGELCGYGGGVARKRWLLEHERRNSP